jgi:hypothetical protein
MNHVDYLHSLAKEREEKRKAAAIESKKAEIEGITFTPSIIHKQQASDAAKKDIFEHLY